MQTLPPNYYKVLDKGYVGLVSNMGDDHSVVQAARVSFDKVSTLDEDGRLSLADERLITYLIKHKHDSVLRHCTLTFEVYAPLMVARQWWKHVINSTYLDDSEGWNESSRRYVTEDEEFYIPSPLEWRMAPADKKQGSAEIADSRLGAKYSQHLLRAVETGLAAYREALADGIAPEQARLLLPAYGMYVRWRWTVSLNGVLNFLSLRLGHGAQSEIVDYAGAVLELVKQKYPLTLQAWVDYRC